MRIYYSCLRLGLESQRTACYSRAEMLLLEALWGRALVDGRLAHAYLMVGEGAALVAREFLLRIYCESRCRACAVCSKILHGNHPDVQWVQREEKRIGIDQIRQLQRDARYRPLEADRKVYVIDGAEDLSLEAANSLLKILESPPEYVMFLLLARSLKVIPTILSRCQIIRLKPLAPSELREVLQAQGLSEKEAEYALALVQGFPSRLAQLLDLKRDGGAVGLLERKRKAQEELRRCTGPQLAELFAQTEDWIVQREATLEFLQRLRAQKPHEILEMAQILSRLDAYKLELFFEEALRWYRDLALVGSEEELIFNRDRLNALREERADLPFAQIVCAIEALEGTQEALQGNANVQLLFESLLFTLAGSS